MDALIDDNRNSRKWGFHELQLHSKCSGDVVEVGVEGGDEKVQRTILLLQRLTSSYEVLPVKESSQSVTVCQMGQCSDISATSVFQVKTSLSGFKRLWGDTRVMWTHFFTFWISGCVSEMAQKWSILGKNPQFSSLGATEAQDGW